MTLGFSTHIKNKPTLFVEKILASLHYDLKQGGVLNEYLQVEKYGYKTKNELIDTIRLVKSKKHTIRKDQKNRWKVGNEIHFVINNRTKKRFQFAPVVKCISIQKIEIIENCWHKFDIDSDKNPFIIKRLRKDKKGFCEIPMLVLIDSKRISLNKLYQLAINDGFDSIEDFFNYFNADFIGKIIHWTDCKY